MPFFQLKTTLYYIPSHNWILSQKAMDLAKPGSVSIETEPGTQEEVASEIPYTDIDIDLLDAKEECLQYVKSVLPISKLHCVHQDI